MASNFNASDGSTSPIKCIPTNVSWPSYRWLGGWPWNWHVFFIKIFCLNFYYGNIFTVQKITFSIIGFFSKCDQISMKLGIWSHLLKKSLMENLVFLSSGFFSILAWRGLKTKKFKKMFFFCPLPTNLH